MHIEAQSQRNETTCAAHVFAEPVYVPAFTTCALDTGISMRYAVLGDASKPAMMLIHGATDSYCSYAQLAPMLADAGYCVYVPELRGHGGTDKPDDGYYTLALYVADIVSLIRKLGLTRLHIVGHSLGGFVAQGVAAQKDAGYVVTGLTLIATGATTKDNPTLGWILEGDGEFPGMKGFDDGVPDSFIVEWAATNNEDKLFKARTLDHAKALPTHTWINTFFGLKDVDTRAQLSTISCPVQIIWGSKDDFFSRDDQMRLIESLTACPNVDFITLAGASHNVHWDAGMRGLVAQAMRSFLLMA